MPLELFTPIGSTVALTVTGTTSSGTLTPPVSTQGYSVRLYNAGTVTAFFKFGVAGITAATTDTPLPAGGVEVFEVSPTTTTIAAINSGTSGTLYATAGKGS